MCVLEVLQFQDRDDLLEHGQRVHQFQDREGDPPGYGQQVQQFQGRDNPLENSQRVLLSWQV